MKMAYVMAFCVNSIKSSKRRYQFPFQSVLGETYELDYNQNQIKFKFISEQIKIDPNIISYHCMGDNFEIWGTLTREINYWGKSIEIEPKGITHIKLKDHNFIFSNAYKIKITKLENENPEIDIEGDITFENLETKDQAEIAFRKEFLITTNYNFLGSIKNSKGETRFKLFGIWDSNFILENTKTKKAWELSKKEINDLEMNVFSNFAMQLNAINVELIEKLPLSDSRFRGDVRALELGEIKLANEEKNKIKGKENERIGKSKEMHRPRFFEENSANGKEGRQFVFKGNYWKIREEGFEEEIDLF